MIKIATHDSATGEKPYWYCYPLMPFARTQSKTIKEQYQAGCRSFDIRIKKHRGDWHCAHGLLIIKRTAEDIISEIASFKDCQVCITYEGLGDKEFLDFVHLCKIKYPSIIWGGIATKYDAKGIKVNYNYLEKAEPGYEGGTRGYLPLDGRTLHTYLPIPWLWNKLYTKNHKFNNETYTYVDFL